MCVSRRRLRAKPWVLLELQKAPCSFSLCSHWGWAVQWKKLAVTWRITILRLMSSQDFYFFCNCHFLQFDPLPCLGVWWTCPGCPCIVSCHLLELCGAFQRAQEREDVCSVPILVSMFVPISLLSCFLRDLFSLLTADLDLDIHAAWFAVVPRAEVLQDIAVTVYDFTFGCVGADICLMITQILYRVWCCAGGQFGPIQSEEPFALCWTGPLRGSACPHDGRA